MRKKYYSQAIKLSIYVIFVFVVKANFAQSKNINLKMLTEEKLSKVLDTGLYLELVEGCKIIKAFSYKDKSGENYIVLSAREYMQKNKKPRYDTIYAACLGKAKSGLFVKWKMRDFIIDRNEANTPEFSIWFWPQHLVMKDIDSDGFLDVILVYSTSGKEYTGNGRSKILIYYKGSKYAIRHQNDTWDYGVIKTKIDAGYYKLPQKIQKQTEAIMKQMSKHNQARFPMEYEKYMRQKRLIFEDN